VTRRAEAPGPLTPELLAPRLQAWAVERRERIVADLGELVALDSPSGDVELLDANLAILERWSLELGGRIERTPTRAGTHLECQLGLGTARPVVVIAHYDTVWPRGTSELRPFSIDDGVIHGPGVFDMRGGLVAAVNSLRALIDLGALDRPVVLLLTADEEIGSTTSKEMIVRWGRESSAVIIPEPPLPDGGMKIQRKGVLTYRASIRGREAHAGLDPERGVSAVHELLTFAHEARDLSDAARGTTVNVGVVAGGTRANVVASDASAEIDVRASTVEEYARVESWFENASTTAAGAELTVERLFERPPMERTSAIADAAARTRALASLLGIELAEGAAGGSGDANLLARYDVPIVDGVGPRGGGAHAVDEHIFVDSLVERVALLALLVAAL
jgi:glutamate carboxypeptidase